MQCTSKIIDNRITYNQKSLYDIIERFLIIAIELLIASRPLVLYIVEQWH